MEMRLTMVTRSPQKLSLLTPTLHSYEFFCQILYFRECAIWNCIIVESGRYGTYVDS